MKILITGSAGFIDFSFSKYLLEKTNHKIIGIDNLNDYYAPKIKKFTNIKLAISNTTEWYKKNWKIFF